LGVLFLSSSSFAFIHDLFSLSLKKHERVASRSGI